MTADAVPRSATSSTASEGEKCQSAGCSGIVRRFTQNGRSTFWCPKCQK